MGGSVKNYFKKECQLRMCSLEYEDQTDFCISCWQRNRSVWPLLLIRTLIMIGCVGTVIASFVIMVQGQMSAGHWFIFMTHWGLLINTVASVLAFGVSVTELFRGADSTPPALVKCYWLSYNIASTIAFFITIFYWSFLTDVEGDYAMDMVLDVFIHGINSVLMFCLLVTSRHPHRLMHFYFPLLFGIVYMIFSIIYYFAGGLSPFGTVWIYPMLDWSKPGETVLMIVGTVILIILIHMIVALMTVGRDALTKRYRDSTVIPISSGENNGMSSSYLR